VGKAQLLPRQKSFVQCYLKMGFALSALGRYSAQLLGIVGLRLWPQDSDHDPIFGKGLA
jgi:hypothetical protein